MSSLDKRLHAFRPDLAEASLKGKVEAQAFSEGTLKQVRTPVASLRREPSPSAMQLSEALMGESLRVLDERDGWAWVKLEADSYVGYVESVALRSEVLAATHEVSAPSTLVYPKADIKSQPAHMIPMLAQLSVIGQEKDYLLLASGGYVFARHVRPYHAGMGDFVAVAERFLFTPYYWGGKTIRGLDCSGLVQVSFNAVGWPALRDSDMQEATLGTLLPPAEHKKLRRGDLVFWKGHVGIMADAETLLHASGHHMMVAIEPLSEAVARNEAAGKPITSIRRMA
ncbi:MAG: C40 family peptidase [Proteobacteria bacterium]|nr:C40 family peptidase [Pseudomonadota bacterium]